eukprot:gene3845-2725_t
MRMEERRGRKSLLESNRKLKFFGVVEWMEMRGPCKDGKKEGKDCVCLCLYDWRPGCQWLPQFSHFMDISIEMKLVTPYRFIELYFNFSYNKKKKKKAEQS